MQPEARFLLSQTVSSIWVLQAIYAGVELGVFETLADKPLSPAAVAQTIDADSGAVRRLLRGLAVLGLLRQRPSGDVELTDAGRLLTKDAAGSLREWTLFRLGPGMWQSWGRLPEVIRRGKCVGELDGHPDWMAAFEDDVVQARLLDESMAALTRRSGEAIIAACNLEGAERVVDVGGGAGELAAACLSMHPELRGIIFDLERVRPAAQEMISARGLSQRCEFVVGSFFEKLPGGASAYLLKSCLCDWDDERTLAILRVCRDAMSSDSRLLIIEPLVPEQLAPSPNARTIVGSDLNMLVVTGGCERTEAEFRQLLETAGLRVADVRDTGLLFKVLEARLP